MERQNKEQDFFFLIRFLQKLISADLDKRLSEYDLTGQQGRILFFIYGMTNIKKQEVHQNDLENEFHLSKSTVSGLVKRMEKRGFINIEKQHPYAILTPTEKANEVINHLEEHREEAINQLIKDVDEKDREITIKTLNRFINNMKEGS